MKVSIVVKNSVWFDPRVRKQIIEYMKKGFELTCIGYKCNRYDEEKSNEMPCPVIITDIDDKYKKTTGSIFKKIFRELSGIANIRKAIIDSSPDLIHANDFNVLVAAYQASKKLHCKIVYDSHEVCMENYINGKKRGGYYLLRACEKHIMKHVDQTICVSHAASAYFADTYHIKPPLVVTNCVLKDEIVSVTESKVSEFEVLNQGQFYNGRGYEQMIEVAKLVEDYDDIRIALRGFGVLNDKLHQRAEELHLKNINFYQPIKVQEMISMASKSHVGVAITEPICLNFKLSVSNKIFEYAAAGLPVIMSDIPEHQFLNKKYKFGIILTDNSPEELLKAVLKFYKDKEFYNLCAQNAKKLSEQINWENEFGKLIAIERKL